MSDVVDAQTYFPDVPRVQLHRGLNKLIEGETKAAIAILRVDPISINKKNNNRRDFAICEIARRFYADCNPTKRGNDIKIKIDRYYGFAWKKNRLSRTNPHTNECIEYFIWEALKANSTPIGSGYIAGIIRERSIP